MIGTTKPERKRGRGIWITLGLCVVLLGSVVAWGLSGRSLHAPDWLRDRIAARIAQDMPNLGLSFGTMSLASGRDALLRVRLTDVDILDRHGDIAAEMAQLEAAFAPVALLQGRLELRQARVTGAALTVRRQADGTLALALGDAFAPGDAVMPDLPQIVARVDAAFADARLEALRAVTAEGLILRFEDARARRGWTADGGRLRLTREGNMLRLAGDVAVLGGGAQAAAVELNASSALGDAALEFGLLLDGLPASDIATQSPALAWLDALRAPISGALRGGIGADGALQPLHATLQIGAGVLQPTTATRALPFDAASAYFTFQPAKGVIRFDEIAVSSPLATVAASGTARLDGGRDGWPHSMAAQLRLTDLHAAEGLGLPRDLALAGAEAAFQVGLDPFQIRLGALRVQDADLPVRLSGRVLAARTGWRVALDAHLAQTTLAQVLPNWPEEAAPRARSWLARNVLQATLRDARLSLRGEPDARPVLYLDTAIEGAQIRYADDLPPLDAASGRLILNDRRLAIRIDEGALQVAGGPAVSVAGSRFVIPDLRARPAQAQIGLQAEGPLQAVLGFLDNPAWQVMTKAGLSPAIATGTARLRGEISLPLRKGVRLPDIAMQIGGNLSDLRSDALVPGRALQADRLELELSETQVALSGPVTLSGIQAQARWQQALGPGAAPGQVAAQVRVNSAALEALGVTLPPGALSGAGVADLRLGLRRDAPMRFDITSDLRGIGLQLPPLGWAKPPGAAGRLALSGTLGRPLVIDRIALEATGLRAAGRIGLTPSGQLDALVLDRLQAGAWLDVTGRLTGRGPGQPPVVQIAGGRVDLRTRPATEGGGGAGAPVPLSLRLDRLVLSDRVFLDDLQGDFAAGSALDGQFTARLGGQAAIDGLAVAEPAGTAWRITAQDAGDVLKGAQTGLRLQDGTFDLSLRPRPGAVRGYDGLLRINETRLRDTPLMGALLDAISLVGILDQMNGPGIYFQEVVARFRIEGPRLTLAEARAVGPSMGISLDGYANLASGQLDLQGVLSPIYFLNGIGQLVSRRGEGLIGFNFDMTGSMTSPSIQVNPLSALTPGLFREIFRRPPPELSQ